MVAIAHGKSVILAEQYKKMNYFIYNENYFAHLYPIIFEIGCRKREGDQNIFVMDNDPSQTWQE